MNLLLCNYGQTKAWEWVTVKMNLTVTSLIKTINLPANTPMNIYTWCLMLFNKLYSGKTVRSISVTLSNIEDDVNQQLSLFKVDNEKRMETGFVMDGIRSNTSLKPF